MLVFISITRGAVCELGIIPGWHDESLCADLLVEFNNRSDDGPRGMLLRSVRILLPNAGLKVDPEFWSVDNSSGARPQDEYMAQERRSSPGRTVEVGGDIEAARLMGCYGLRHREQTRRKRANADRLEIFASHSRFRCRRNLDTDA